MKSRQYAHLYPRRLPTKLGFDQIQDLLRRSCQSDLGARHVDTMPIYTHADVIQERLQQTQELLYMLHEASEDFPRSGYVDLTGALEYLAVPNAVLELEIMQELRQFLETIQRIYRALHAHAEDCPRVFDLLRGTHFERSMLRDINRVIDDTGSIRPGVSPVLERLHRKMRQAEEELNYRFDNVLRHCREQGWLSEDLRETIRNGKRVLPLAAEHKRKIRGVVQGESATGKTVFVEPERTVEAGNHLYELQQEAHRELMRILRELTARLAPHHQTLQFYQELAGEIDFLQAKCRLAEVLDASAPQITEDHMHIRRGRHPILYLRHQEEGQAVVPLDMQLDRDQRVLMVSGPNAGGKSVVLKTVGLLQMMLQAGLPVPADENSLFPVFDQIFIDIGDEQSIENDLSTYSSHLANMRYFIDRADAASLMLIDEFGSGTDPKVGGAIAEAILEHFLDARSFCVVTTHYSNLKIFADLHRGVANGAMAFDETDLRPLYELQQGKPGSSYAFELAHQSGLPEDILQKARDKVGEEFQSYDTLLADLERHKVQYDQEKRKLDQQRSELERLQRTYERLKEDFEKNRKDKLKEAEQSYAEELRRINRAFENTVKTLRSQGQGQALDRDDTGRKAFKEQLDQARSQVSQKMQERKRQEKQKQRPVQPEAEGQRVKLRGSEEVGIVERLEGNKARVAFGQLRTSCPVSELEVVDAPRIGGARTASKAQGGASFDYVGAHQAFSQTLDLRGRRKDEALQKLDTWLDQAVLTGQQQLRIVHGKGNGVLREAVRSLLAKYHFVRDVQSDLPEQGGDGVTLVALQSG